jgi:thiamine-phosphate pyrophosphorylase
MVIAVWTDRRQARLPLVDVVSAAVDGGARLVVLRERDLPDAQRAALAARLHVVLAPVAGRLLLSGPVPGPDGVHLAAADPLPALPGGVVGRSCHDAAQLRGAQDEGADYATLSPVFVTASKPGYGPPLGTERLAQLCAGTALPVLALGGVDSPRRARDCVAAGAAGVAVMGAVMRAPDPARFVANLLDAVAGHHARAGGIAGAR